MGSSERSKVLGPNDWLTQPSEHRDFALERMSIWLERLRTIVETHSGADSPEGRERVAEQLAEWAQQAGCDCELVPTAAGSHLVARLPGQGAGRIVLLGHHDTVFDRDAGFPWRLSRCDHRAFGPGVADMKGGLLLGLLAIESLARGDRPFEAVEFHSVPDEESRWDAFETLDRIVGARAVLVLECGRENGDVVLERKTAALVRVRMLGRPAHVGTEAARGRDAVLALCTEVLRWSALSRERAGLTVVTCQVSGGSRAAVVPEHGDATVDVRAWSSRDLSWALEEIANSGADSGVDASIEVLGSTPPMIPSPESKRMSDVAVAIAGTLGVTFGAQSSGGASDGCFTANAGIPTLDGLGPVGGKDHSADEYIDLDCVPVRCAVVAGLCEAIGGAKQM